MTQAEIERGRSGQILFQPYKATGQSGTAVCLQGGALRAPMQARSETVGVYRCIVDARAGNDAPLRGEPPGGLAECTKTLQARVTAIRHGFVIPHRALWG